MAYLQQLINLQQLCQHDENLSEVFPTLCGICAMNKQDFFKKQRWALPSIISMGFCKLCDWTIPVLLFLHIEHIWYLKLIGFGNNCPVNKCCALFSGVSSFLGGTSCWITGWGNIASGGTTCMHTNAKIIHDKCLLYCLYLYLLK